MPKFTFRLATLLRLREATRDERRLQLAEAYRVDEVLQQRLRAAAEELQALRQRCRQAVGPGTVDVDRIVAAQRYELALRAFQRGLEQQREAVAAEIERRRLALVEANREVRVLEKLREKQAARFQEEENRRDIRRLDEVALQRAAREAVLR
jgi:flagellar FliJ protein